MRANPLVWPIGLIQLLERMRPMTRTAMLRRKRSARDLVALAVSR